MRTRICGNRLSWMLLATLVAGAIVCGGQEKEFPAPKETNAAVQFGGRWTGTYSSNLVKPTKVELIFQQRGNVVSGSYLSADGAQGVISGAVQNSGGFQGTAQQITPTCPGSFMMKANVAGEQMQWTFSGQDCLGMENGSGKATRTGGQEK